MKLKTSKTIALLALMANFATAECLAQNTAEPKYVVNGYVGGYRGLVDTEAIEIEKLTHINYAFVNVQDSMAVLTNLKTDSVNFRKLNELKYARNPDLKILISIGGWAWSENFSDAVLTPTSRQLFAKSSVDIVRQYNLDGVDIDWEYPGMPGEEGNIYRPEDKQNYTLMFEEIRKELDKLSTETGKEYQLTTAVGASESYIANTEMDKVSQILDYIFIMTYDYGGRNNTVNHHTNLYPSKSVVDGSSGHQSVQNFIAAGTPPEKIVLGAAFYGKAFEATPGSKDGLAQPRAAAQGQGAAQNQGGGYTKLLQTAINKNGYKRYWDKAAKAPYLFNKDTNVFITYDDEKSIKEKVKYVKEHNHGGIFFWEYFSDPEGHLLNTIDSNL